MEAVAAAVTPPAAASLGAHDDNGQHLGPNVYLGDGEKEEELTGHALEIYRQLVNQGYAEADACEFAKAQVVEEPDKVAPQVLVLEQTGRFSTEIFDEVFQCGIETSLRHQHHAGGMRYALRTGGRSGADTRSGPSMGWVGM